MCVCKVCAVGVQGVSCVLCVCKVCAVGVQGACCVLCVCCLSRMLCGVCTMRVQRACNGRAGRDVSVLRVSRVSCVWCKQQACSGRAMSVHRVSNE